MRQKISSTKKIPKVLVVISGGVDSAFVAFLLIRCRQDMVLATIEKKIGKESH